MRFRAHGWVTLGGAVVVVGALQCASHHGKTQLGPPPEYEPPEADEIRTSGDGNGGMSEGGAGGAVRTPRDDQARGKQGAIAGRDAGTGTMGMTDRAKPDGMR